MHQFNPTNIMKVASQKTESKLNIIINKNDSP